MLVEEKVDTTVEVVQFSMIERKVMEVAIITLLFVAVNISDIIIASFI